MEDKIMSPFTRTRTDFEQTYDQYVDILYRIAYSYMNHKEDAEDVIQEVFTKYMCGFHLYRNEEHKKAWLIRVTINQCHDAIRKNRYRIHAPLEEVKEVAGQENEILQELRETLNHLPNKYKDIVLLHYLEGYTVEEVSHMLGLSNSAVKMRLRRSREWMKKELE